MPKSSLRVIDILETLASAGEPMSHTQLATTLGIPKSSLSALLRDLEQRGFVFLDATNHYVVGSAVLGLARAFVERLDIVRFGRPIISQIVARVDEATALALIDGDQAVVVAQETSSRLGSPQTMTLGQRAPLSTTSAGKIMLAFLPQEERDRRMTSMELPRMARNSITDREALAHEIQNIRENYLAYSREEAIDGIIAVGVPVWGAGGEVVAALSTASPVHRFTPEAELEIVAALRSGAERLTISLGGKFKRAA